MERERDLFRAIVIAGLAITSGCGSTSTTADAGHDAGMLADAGMDAGIDAGTDAGEAIDAGDAGEDGMVLIL